VVKVVDAHKRARHANAPYPAVMKNVEAVAEAPAAEAPAAPEAKAE